MTKNSTYWSNLQQYGFLYETNYPDWHIPGTCFYCGDLKSEQDHCPPVSWADTLISKQKSGVLKYLKVPCCQHCNKILGSKALFTLLERVEHVHESLADKYDHELCLWSEDELKEMSREFQIMIRARRENLNILHARVKNSEKRLLEEKRNPA